MPRIAIVEPDRCKPKDCGLVCIKYCPGVRNLTVRIEGGIHGDIGTTAMIVNSIPKVINASPGLHTMRDLSIPSIIQTSL